MKIDSTVSIVDDDPAVRRLLTKLVESVGLHAESFESAADFLDTVSPDRPGCLVLDIRMPVINGLELQQKLIERRSTMPIIMLTGHSDVPTAVQSLKAGAFDFVEKPFQNDRLLETIQAALRMDQLLRTKQVHKTEIETRLAMLTPREKQVMDLIVAGEPNKLIAKTLVVSIKSIEFHRANIMRKMGAKNVADLVRMITEIDERNSKPSDSSFDSV